MGSRNVSSIPPTTGAVQEKLLKFKQGGPSVEEARAAMLAAKEPASTFRNPGGAVPKFIRERQDAPGAPTATAVVTPAAPASAAAEPNPQVSLESSSPMKNDQGERKGGNAPAIETPLQSGLRKVAYAVRLYNLPPKTVIDLNQLAAMKTTTGENYLSPEEVAALQASQAKAPVPAEPEAAAVSAQPVIADETVPAHPTITRVAVEDTTRQHYDDKKFSVEVYFDKDADVDERWVAELTYKNGSGMERFTAPSRDKLTMKMAIGKANGTVKVRETVQRYKLGNEYNTWDYFFDKVKESHGVTKEEFLKLPQTSQDLIQDAIQAVEMTEFLKLYPEYYGTQGNLDKIGALLNKAKVPLTLHNMELAYTELNDAELLETKPVSSRRVVELPAPAAATRVEDSTPVTAPPAAPAPAAAAAVVPAAPVRKRVTTGIVPGSSSAAPSGATLTTEEGTEQPGLSVAELRALGNTKEGMAQLRRLATVGRVYPR
jgi:hypothetical protein